MEEATRNFIPLVIGASGTGATFWLAEYGLPWIGAVAGLMTIIHLCFAIRNQIKK